ncbi:XRE family transcriptional regulator [Leptospira santarosai]|uniref:XRE family transcriptional regulator n=1 Tax=Leptospira santarosai TaxID=28183 RepID=UPI001E59E830
MAIKKETIDQIILRRQHCLDTIESDREMLIDFIREYVDAKRGNQMLLSNASGIPQNKISNLVRDNGFPPGMEIILTLAKTIKNIQ